MTTNEDDENIKVAFACYKTFFSRYYGPWFFICSQGAMCLFLASKIANDLLLGSWVSDPN